MAVAHSIKSGGPIGLPQREAWSAFAAIFCPNRYIPKVVGVLTQGKYLESVQRMRLLLRKTAARRVDIHIAAAHSVFCSSALIKSACSEYVTKAIKAPAPSTTGSGNGRRTAHTATAAAQPVR